MPGRENLRAAYVLTALGAVAMAIVSAGGVFASSWLYRDNALVTATFRGQDVVTLFVAAPLLLAGLVLEMRGSQRGRILWLGMLFYTMYGYLFYCVAAAFNQFFLLYVATFAFATYALLFSVPRIDLAQTATAMGGRTARIVAVAYMAVVAVGLAALWVGISLSFVFTRVVPAPIVASGHPTGVVFAIDLVFIVPPMLLGAVWLARRRPLGWVLAGVMSVGGSVYTLTLAVASAETLRVGVGSGGELPIWVALTLLGTVSAVMLLLGVRTARPSPGSS